MSIDWRGWSYLAIIAVAVIGFIGYGTIWKHSWATWTGVLIIAAFICFVIWLLNVMNTDI